ncbi:Pyruvate/2-oxoglutarate/acetoin dehydrogenase complex, dehydrogenase (E1) component [Fodinibius salinus]|uniref:3-methyl-2-oxobutanoate dehydrogenase (2-methylpropanoyl-transferring) n=1 Tax=Fodinibius salinus TaxID=860790 RepID=A0A5D3YH59_9BACT|nr:alpha-ketoacid dehydrogenase subunit alpha/beta [Fodinibius salinus]TYP92654.1 Pyruvate/2-oxoglutarate/acetoin dehydrogenase complex, dehydrogenase (E1) component [Fodinibius salinus]
MAPTKTKESTQSEAEIDIENRKEEILQDYKLAVKSREVSYIGRKETLTGKAKFGIFGDGKELPQIAMAKYFKNGDFRAGYYRDQTFMMAIDQVTIQQFFAQLYAHANIEEEPNSGGRQMNAHFSTRSLNDDGSWKDLTEMKNTSPDISPTAGQMSRLLGLAQASQIYRNHDELLDKEEFQKFSDDGSEIAWGTIGDASTSEGVFWETINAAGVLQVPMVLSVWDDGYGISVPRKYQTTKESISDVLAGFQRTEDQEGLEILTVNAWDYPALMKTYEEAAAIAREEHVPVLIHVKEVTQPQGHSTSGSHERYKSDERLEWEEEFCCINKTRQWLIDEDIATADEIEEIEEAAKSEVKDAQKAAWKSFKGELKEELKTATALIDDLSSESSHADALKEVKKEMKAPMVPLRKYIVSGVRKALRIVRDEQLESKNKLKQWLDESNQANEERYDTHLYSETADSPLNVEEVTPTYSDDPEEVDGRVVLRDNFDKLFEQYPETLVFGEDTGKLGDVNKGLENMQDKYGELRVRDTGIREATILGQGIGMALRGLRPIAEIQYLDYLLYCFQGLSDDLATVRYRSMGGQKAPLIVRTRGHRLEGIWHTGSPMGMIINGVRGLHVCVPRNLTEAAGMYNTLLQGDDPALMIEPLNAYRLKEKMPDNLGEFTVPLGIPNIVSEGSDITIVSYGSTCNICESVLPELEEVGISAELIDVRTLLPFDRNQDIVASLEKTNRILFVDEDVPGGASAYMMNKVLQEQKGYYYLDSEPQCLTAKAHRGAYGSDGDYFSKPNEEDIFEAIYALMSEANPAQYPPIYE